MNGQTKNRKDRRRFTRLMSLLLSASLVFGNTALVYAGTQEGPNDDIGPNEITMESPDDRSRATEGDSSSVNLADISENITISVNEEKVSINEGVITVSTADEIGAAFENVKDNITAVVISNNVVSAASFNSTEGAISVNTTSANSSQSGCDVITTISVNGTISLKGVSYNGYVQKELAKIKVVDESEKPTSVVNIGNVSVNVTADPANKTVSSQEEARRVVDGMTATEVYISDNKLSGNEIGEKNITVSFNLDGDVTASSNENVTATVTIAGPVDIDGVSYNGTAEVAKVATVRLEDNGGEEPGPSPTPGDKGVVDIKDISVNVTADPANKTVSSQEEARRVVDGMTATEVYISDNKLSGNEIGEKNITVSFNLDGDVTASSNENVTATVTIAGPVDIDGVSYNGTAEVAKVATVRLEDNGGEEPGPSPTPGDKGVVDIKDISVNVTADPANKTVSSQEEAVAVVKEMKATEVQISSNKLSGNQISANKITVSFNLDGKVTASSNNNVTATVTVAGPVTIDGVSYNGTATVSQAATIKLAGDTGTDPADKDIVNIDKVSVNVTADPASKAVSSQAEAEAVVKGMKATEVQISSNKLSGNQISANKITVSFNLDGKVTASSNGNVTATVKVNGPVTIGGVSYNGTKTVAKVATIKLQDGATPARPTIDKDTVAWGEEIIISSNIASTCGLYRMDQIPNENNLSGLKLISANVDISKGYTYTTTAEDAGNYVIAAIDEKDHLTMSSCKVEKAVIKTVEVAAGKLNLKVNIKDGKADVITTNQPTVTKINGKDVPEGLTSKDFTFEWEVPTSPAKGQKIDLVVKAAAGNKYYTGNAKTPIGTINSVTVTKKAQTIKVTPTSVSLKEGATKKSKTIKVTGAKGAITATLDKAGKKVVKMTTNKNKTQITVAPKAKKSVGVATITIKAGATQTYNASKAIKVKVTIVPKKKASAKITKVKVTPTKKKGQAKVTWKATKKKNVTGYEIQYSFNKKIKNSDPIVKVGKKTTKTLTKLKSKKVVYVRIRPYYEKNKAMNPGKWTKVVKSKKKVK